MIRTLFLTTITLGVFLPVHAQEDPVINTLLFSRYTQANWQLWAKDMDTAEERRLTISPVDKRSPQMGPDGKTIFYRTANSEIFILDLKTNTEKRVLNKLGTIMDQRWSGDGKRVAFARLRSEVMDDSDIWISDLSGRQVQCLTNQTGLQYSPVFSPDGNMIAFISVNQEGGHTLHLMDRDGDKVRPLAEGTFYDVSPCFSPDGEHLVFASNRSGDYEIWKTAVRTNEFERLTNAAGIDTAPAYSPDGHRIAFVSSRSGSMQIWVMDENGGGVVQITDREEAPCQDPAWVPVSGTD